MEKSLEFLQDMFPLGRQIIMDSYEANNKDLDKTISVLITMCDNTNVKHPPSYEEALKTGPGSNFIDVDETENNKKRRDSRRNLGKKEWKPPLLGPLADDFLTVPNEVSNNAANKGFLCKGCAKFTNNSPVNDEPGVSNPSASFSSSLRNSDLENIDSIIRRRMEDNVSMTRNLTLRESMRQHNSAAGDDLQYLDDERLALMLQNQEFLRIVRSDPEFQQALKEDQEGSICDSDSVDIWREPTDSEHFSPQDNDEDYGYERSDIVEPDLLWPDRLPSNSTSSPSDQNEVTRLCRAMGKTSRNRITSLAKRFSSIRRRKSKNYSSFDSLVSHTEPRLAWNLPAPLLPISSGVIPSRNQRCWETESTQNLIEPLSPHGLPEDRELWPESGSILDDDNALDDDNSFHDNHQFRRNQEASLFEADNSTASNCRHGPRLFDDSGSSNADGVGSHNNSRRGDLTLTPSVVSSLHHHPAQQDGTLI